jgi:hypothetical protein
MIVPSSASINKTDSKKKGRSTPESRNNQMSHHTKIWLESRRTAQNPYPQLVQTHTSDNRSRILNGYSSTTPSGYNNTLRAIAVGMKNTLSGRPDPTQGQPLIFVCHVFVYSYRRSDSLGQPRSGRQSNDMLFSKPAPLMLQASSMLPDTHLDRKRDMPT